MPDLHLACAARGPYVQRSAAMLRSVLANAGERTLHVHYLCDRGLDDDLASELARMVERLGGSIDFLAIDEQAVGDLPTRPEFTSAMWYRILLPDLLPGIDRVLYLDVDTLAVDSLEELWTTDLSASYVAAVSNVFQHNHVQRPAELGLPASQPYFNSGVLLINLELMRRDDCARRVRECALEAGTRLEWPDQDALNLVLGPRCVPLHPRWNCMNAVHLFAASLELFGPEAVALARSHPGIRHFEGPGANKPWHPDCRLPDRDRWREHQAQTPWPSFA